MGSPAGRSVALRSGSYEAVVVEVGGGLRSLTRAGLDVVDGYRADEMSSAGRGQLLVPWPNRIRDGRYRFGGSTHQLALSEPAGRTAIHGLTRWVSWSLLESTDTRARWGHWLPPQPGYPFALRLRVSYDLGPTGLRVEVTATNVGDTPAPYGHGAHPYLTVGRRVDDCELTLPAAVGLEMDERGLPGARRSVDGSEVDFRARRRIGATALDRPFTELRRDDEGQVTVVLRDPETDRQATLWAGPAYPWLQAFTGDTLPTRAREALAVEPMTCPPDAFNTGTDLVTLQPGDTHTGVFGIS
jgi:aldose 1-epimerase